MYAHVQRREKEMGVGGTREGKQILGTLAVEVGGKWIQVEVRCVQRCRRVDVLWNMISWLKTHTMLLDKKLRFACPPAWMFFIGSWFGTEFVYRIDVSKYVR